MGPQFSLRTLLVLFTIVTMYCALAAYSPVLLIIAVPLGIYGLAAWAKSRGAKVAPVEVTVCSLIVLILIALMLPAVQSTPRGGTGRQGTCMNNLHQIGLALEAYHGRFGSYPPAYFADAQGKPLVSWRVLLLPYMDCRPLYDQWNQHRDEPWDGPHNKQLSQTVLEFLHCPSDTGPITDTSYVAVVGRGTIWPGTAQVGKAQITDGVANTILLVEVANSGINWMEPRDLDFTKRAPGINPATGLGVSSEHPGIVNVQYADGRSATLDVTVTEAQLRALLTIAGGEKVVLP